MKERDDIMIQQIKEKLNLSNEVEFKLYSMIYTISKKGVIRATHFQLVKQQPKLVRCISGHVYDVIVDLRPNSPTFGEWRGFLNYW